MTISEEIEELKTKLKAQQAPCAQAEILLQILPAYSKINSTESKPYIDQLEQLAAQTGDVNYSAWALCHRAIYYRLSGDGDHSICEAIKALELFEVTNDLAGKAACYVNLGFVNNIRGNYADALTYYLRSLPLYEQLGDHKGRARVYHHVGAVHNAEGQYADAIRYHQQALEIAQQINDRQGMATSYGNLGLMAGNGGDYNGALDYYEKARAIFEEQGDNTALSKIYNNVGVIHRTRGQYPEALSYYLRALEIGKNSGDKLGLANNYNNIGVIYQFQGNDKEALRNFQMAYDLHQESGNQKGIAQMNNSIGTIYLKQGSRMTIPPGKRRELLERARDYFKTAMQISEEIGNKNEIGNSYKNISRISFHFGGDLASGPDEASASLRLALDYQLVHLRISEETSNKTEVAHAHHFIGEIYQRMGRYDEAIESEKKALSISEELRNKNIIGDAARSLAHTYKSMSDFENALRYYERYNEVNNEILGEQAHRELHQINYQHDMQIKEKELDFEKREKELTQNLLLNILPAEVAEELKEKGAAAARYFNDVTVLFTDFKGFTTVSERLTPQQLVDELHACFSSFDHIMQKYGIEKIKTVGDAYLAVSGLPQANTDHASDIVNAAIEIRDYMLARKRELGDMTFEIRIGVHSGSVVAGIVGVKKFAYDIWGDTVNTAARMEQNSEAGKINISETTYQFVKDKFHCAYRGEIEAKNKGKLKMYFVK